MAAGVTFPRNVGGKQTSILNDVEFVGYGLNLGPGHNDYAGRNVKGKAVMWLGQSGPATRPIPACGRLISSRASIAIEEMGAAATISPVQPAPAAAAGPAAERGGGNTAGLHDGPAPRFAAGSQHHGVRRISRVSLQRVRIEYADLKAKADAARTCRQARSQEASS